MAWLFKAVEMIMQRYSSRVVAEQVVAMPTAQYQPLDIGSLCFLWASMRLHHYLVDRPGSGVDRSGASGIFGGWAQPRDDLTRAGKGTYVSDEPPRSRNRAHHPFLCLVLSCILAKDGHSSSRCPLAIHATHFADISTIFQSTGHGQDRSAARCWRTAVNSLHGGSPPLRHQL